MEQIPCRRHQEVFLPLISSISCLGLARETQHMYQPCFSDMLSSESVSSVSIAPTGGQLYKVCYRRGLNSILDTAMWRKRSWLKHYFLWHFVTLLFLMLIQTFGSFWIQNFLVDFCFFLHLWHMYSSVSSSSSRSVKLRRQSRKSRYIKWFL